MCVRPGFRASARLFVLLSVIAISVPSAIRASEPPEPVSAAKERSKVEVLTAAQWKQMDGAIDRGLSYLLRNQLPDGSIKSPLSGQPGITSLTILAFLSRGHIPGEGPHGPQLQRAVDFVLRCQRKDGLLSAAEPEENHVHAGASHAGNYNHAIAGLMLTEVYGTAQGTGNEKIAETIRAAIKFTRGQQTKPKSNELERGGWRYLGANYRLTGNSDISVTSWQLMFYRSARNANFQVPALYVDEAMQYIRRGFDPEQGTFPYNVAGGARQTTRGVAGGAIVSLALGGEHQSPEARRAADWILKQSFRQYNGGSGPYHYGAFYCSQAMFQMGGEYWERFFPPLVETLVANQAEDGSWAPENHQNGNSFGRTYTTALSVLALTPAYQLLPIYQR